MQQYVAGGYCTCWAYKERLEARTLSAKKYKVWQAGSIDSFLWLQLIPYKKVE